MYARVGSTTVFQLGIKLDSISLPEICTESSKSHTGFCNSGSDLIINVHHSGKSASQTQVGECINNFQFLLSIHSDSRFIVRFPGAGLCTTSVFLR